MSTAWIRKNDLKLILFDISNLVQAENLAVRQTGRPYSLSLRFGHLQDSPLPSLSIASTSSVTKHLIKISLSASFLQGWFVLHNRGSLPLLAPRPRKVQRRKIVLSSNKCGL